MSKEKLRIVKVYVGNTVTYVPEVYKLVTHWFSKDKWEWEKFYFDKYGEYRKYSSLPFWESSILVHRSIAVRWIKLYSEKYLETQVVWEGK